VFTIAVPPGGVATRLRTLGALAGRPTWFEGELMEAEAAAAKYLELTGIGGYYPKDPALLSWRAQERLALQVFPCMPGTSKKVDYELLVPTSYADGRWHLELPAMGTEQVAASASVEVGSAGGRAYVDDRPAAAGVPFRLDRARRVSLEHRTAGPLDGGLASVELGPTRHAVSFHVETAPRLSEVPRGAHVVVVLDGSRSLSWRERDASLAAARAYLGHLRGHGVHVAVTSFARRARDLTPGFVDVDAAIAQIQPDRVPQDNGSEIGEGLARARALLDEAPGSAPRRVLLLSDLEARSSLDAASLRVHLRPGTIAHFATIDDGHAGLRRDDAHPWATLPRATGGLLWVGSAPADEALEPEERDLFAEWVRPRRLDHVVLDAPGGPEVSVPSSIDEGQGIEASGIVAQELAAVTISGELWSTPVRHTVLERPGDDERWSARIFGSELLWQLSEAEMMPLAMRGRAVSPVTSYLAIEPGVRRSFEGLEEAEAGFGASGFGMAGGSAGGRAPSIRMGGRIDRGAWLRERLGKAAAACKALTEKIDVRLETTGWEIVDVEITLSPADVTKHACLIEQVWALHLPAAFDERRATHQVALEPGPLASIP
jgi:hypothetical protein